MSALLSVQLALCVCIYLCVCSIHVCVCVHTGNTCSALLLFDMGVCSCGSRAFVKVSRFNTITFLSPHETLKKVTLIKGACVETASWDTGHTFSSATSSVEQKTSEGCSW